MAIATINPATGETLQTFEPLSDDAVQEKIARAAAAFDADLMARRTFAVLARAAGVPATGTGNAQGRES